MSLSFFLINIVHKVSLFLGTVEGDLFKKSLEVIIFLLICFMIISEYTRSEKREYKYLSIAFAVFFLNSVLSFLMLFLLVFVDFNILIADFVLPVISYSLELIALVLLAHAFMFPFCKDDIIKFRKRMKSKIAFILVVAILIHVLWIIRMQGDVVFIQYFGFPCLEFLKILIIAYALYFIYIHPKGKRDYAYSIMFAFAVYAITPMLNIGMFFAKGTLLASQLKVAAHPFPIISALLFTRVIYLKLADKAYLEKKLKASKTKLIAVKHVSELKDEFVSVVSHELRTPLTSMKLYSSILKSGKLGELNDKQKDAVNVIDEENKRLTELINDILDLSKLEARKDKLRLTEFNLSNFLFNNPHYHIAAVKEMEIKVKIPENVIVKVDEAKFKQVFLNIFSNAVKFTSRVERKGVIVIEYKDLGNSWQLSVKDNGPGIEKNKMNKLFDKFYQADEHMTKHTKGTGLGLTIAKMIVELHKGKIKVESEEGKGSTFYVIMPKEI